MGSSNIGKGHFACGEAAAMNLIQREYAVVQISLCMWAPVTPYKYSKVRRHFWSMCELQEDLFPFVLLWKSSRTDNNACNTISLHTQPSDSSFFFFSFVTRSRSKKKYINFLKIPGFVHHHLQSSTWELQTSAFFALNETGISTKQSERKN